MTMLRRRMTVAAATLLTAGLAACNSAAPTSPLADFNADGDTLKKVPTIPWAEVTAVPTIPWAEVTTVPTIPWADVTSTVPTIPWASVRRSSTSTTNH